MNRARKTVRVWRDHARARELERRILHQQAAQERQATVRHLIR